MTNTHEVSETQTMHNESLRRVLHDLSNTLTGLLMNAGLLSVALRGNDKLRRYTEEITEAAEHSALLVKQARTMVSPAAGEGGGEAGVTNHCDNEAGAAKVLELLDLPPISRRTQ